MCKGRLISPWMVLYLARDCDTLKDYPWLGRYGSRPSDVLELTQ